MMPAKAASAEPIAKVISTMAVKLMPMVRAVSSSCATARMARPSLVRLSRSCRPTMTSDAGRQHQHVVEPQIEAAEVDRAGRQQRRKRLRVGALRIEQPHRFAQHGAEHQRDQQRVERRRRAQRHHQIARDQHAERAPSPASRRRASRRDRAELSRRRARRSPTKVASAAKAPTVSTSPCENLITSSTPKNSVKPTATSAYIMPSISPFMTYCASSPASMASVLAPRSGRAGPALRGARHERQVYFWPGSLRLPLAYSLSSHSTNLPSWITYLVITGTVFWP